jgi:hypothetical protein
MIEDFKKKLNDLLTEFPDLGEFTIRVRPRLTVEMAESQNKNQVPHNLPVLKPTGIGNLESSITPGRIAELSKSSVIEQV